MDESFSTAAHLSKVSRMVLVKVDPVVMLTTSVSTSSRMLPVLSNPGQNIRENRVLLDINYHQLPAVPMRHMTSQLPGLLLASGHPPPLVSPLKRDKSLVIRSTK